MKLQTTIGLQPQKHNQIDYDSKLMLLGSCFSENIGAKFQYFKFQSYINPFGILFHPVAIENLVTRSINRDVYTEEEVVHHKEVYSCLDAHSKLNASSKELLLNGLNEQIELTHKLLKTSSHIIITLGTAWIYRYISADKIVANCHKIPQKQFLKELLTIEEIVSSLENTIALIRSINPKVSFIFTVSPVRHLKDGFVENNISKAHLLSAIHQVVEPRQQIFYFPSYEIMMDELRDYRFYKQDMIHPNDLAVNHIWEKFKDVWLSDSTKPLLETIHSIQLRKAHKPFNPDSDEHKNFLEKLHKDINDVQSEYPQINF